MHVKLNSMKKLLFMCLALAAFGMVSMSSDQSLTVIDGEPREYIYIKLKNECDQAVKYESIPLEQPWGFERLCK